MATITLDEFNRSLSDMVRTGAIGEAIHRATIYMEGFSERQVEKDEWF